MNRRLRLTFFNWRWWLILPIAILCVPLILLNGLLTFIESVCAVTNELIERIPAWKIREWVQKDSSHD